MAAGRAQVLNCTVDVRYFDGNQKRILSISTTPVSGDPVNTVFIQFLDATPPNNGFYVPPNRFLAPTTRLRDFEDTYHVLRTERPVFIEFISDAASNALTRFRLGAVEEPPGEGPGEYRPRARSAEGCSGRTGQDRGISMSLTRAAAVGDRWVTGLPREVLVPRPVTFALKAASSASVLRCWTTRPDGSRLQ